MMNTKSDQDEENLNSNLWQCPNGYRLVTDLEMKLSYPEVAHCFQYHTPYWKFNRFEKMEKQHEM